ncbi:MAG: FMN-binding protein [Acidobacteria bacterium]|nr:FMN-binding protein [Acidobacteriota bacterium]
MRARRAGFVLLAFALGLWGVAGIAGGRRPEPDLLPFLKRAWPMASYDRRADGVVVVRRQGEAIGYGASASAAGYGGPITVALAVTPAGAIHAAAFLEYRDTPGLRPSVQGLLGEIVGRSVRDPLAVDDDLDAITGATQSSLGVAAATRGAAERLAERAAVGQGSLALGAPEGVLLLLFALALYGRHNRKLATRSRRSLRWLALVGSFATLGWLWNRPYVLAFPLRLAAGDWPALSSYLYWYLLLALLLLGFDRTGRGPWCPWLCPFGAAQDVVGLVGGARRRRPAAPRLFRWLKRLLLVAAVALGLYYRSPGAASYEVFATLFRGEGSSLQVAILVFVGASALFVARPFCHWLCPVDGLERGLRFLRARGLHALGRGRRTAPAPRSGSLLPVVASRPVRVPRDPLRVLRDRVFVGVGLLCAALVVAHLASAFGAMSRGSQSGLMSESFAVAPNDVATR